ncbi:MAG: glycosyltransferase family 4 protein [Verrucomicrobia bacterium]|nr:glycosyltransferase family 4 protein [Verrucomicrobiota bacterium]
MRILVVHNILNDAHSVNGVMRHYVLMAKHWIHEQHPTDFVVAKAGWPQFRQLAPASRLLSSDGFFDASRRIAMTWSYLPAYAYRMLTAHWMRLPQPYDVVVASGMFISESYAAYVLARRCKAKFAVKIHHVVTAQESRSGFFNRLLFHTERYSCRLIHRHADVIFCSVPGVAEDYARLERELGLEPRRVVVSGYGLDFGEFEPAGGGPQPYDVLFLGRMHEQKGVFDLPRYWRSVREALPAARLMVIGEGPHRPRVMEACRELGLGDSVTFTGGVDDRRKNELLRQSKVGISLSYEEGWGLSICEYLAAGLPVVAYRLPVFAQVFPGQLDEVDLGDWREAAARTVAWLGDERKRRERAEAGRRFIVQYDYREVARNELAALAAACESPMATR